MAAAQALRLFHLGSQSLWVDEIFTWQTSAPHGPLTWTDLIENPLGQPAIADVAVDDSQIYVGTSLGENGLENKKGEAPKFGVIDLASKQVVFEQAFNGAGEVNRIVYDPASKRVFFSAGGRLICYVPAELRPRTAA